MHDFNKIDLKDRRPYLEMAATNSGFPLNIIEKDFWVCWTLERLFNLENIGTHLIFKGGTTLSKVYSVIDRFSEDIDLSIDREKLGFTGEKDPEQSMSVTRQKLLVEELSSACKIFVQNELYNLMRNEIASALGKNDDWDLVIDEDDPDGQTILFHYPTVENSYGDYIHPRVKIEMGARSDHWPAYQCFIKPYLHEHLEPNMLTDYKVLVKVLDVARTFWEKATILHMYAHWPEGKTVTPRQSRHYYDFYKLLQSTYVSDALSKLDLLARVAKHKEIYFRAVWAKYDQANIGTLKLAPSSKIENDMRKDYQAMQEMIFKDPPTWDKIMIAINNFENEFNMTVLTIDMATT